MASGAGSVEVFDPGEGAILQAALARQVSGTEDRLLLSLAGEQDLEGFQDEFDVLLCMGVLYHRRDPWSLMRRLRTSLRPGGTLLLETIIWPGEGRVGFIPPDRYAGMRNVYLLPTLDGLRALAERAGFVGFEEIHTGPTSLDEQRVTRWTTERSLADWLDPDDPSRTIEGLPAPVRSVCLCRT